MAPTSYLTTAWRNGRNILSAANVISAPLSAAAARTGPAGERESGESVEVPPLQPSPAAAQGKVVIGRFATDEDEAKAIAADVLRYRVTDFEDAARRGPDSSGHGSALPPAGPDGMHPA